MRARSRGAAFLLAAALLAGSGGRAADAQALPERPIRGDTALALTIRAGEPASCSRGSEWRIRICQCGPVHPRSGHPLWVIDGVPLPRVPLASRFITYALLPSPEIIHSIESLRGAAAEARYGRRAMDGVVFITTKRAARAP